MSDPLKIESSLSDEQVLFLSDILPTGYMGAEMCDIKPGDTVAVWGCGPVGLFAIKSAFLLGAERVIAIDRFEYRLAMARDKCQAETLNYEEVDSVPETLMEMTAGRGPDSCIDAVGLEAHGHGFDYLYDRTKQALSWRPTGRSPSAKRSWPAATAAPSRSSASMAGWSTSSRSAPS